MGGTGFKCFTTEQYDICCEQARSIPKLGPLVEATPAPKEFHELPKPSITATCEDMSRFSVILEGKTFPLGCLLEQHLGFTIDNGPMYKFHDSAEDMQVTITDLGDLCATWGWELNVQ